ncbi:MAG: adaptor protein MecA [Clostridiales bacterium]|nr:adaptor protein MecA [Clostridiales bacterium]
MKIERINQNQIRCTLYREDLEDRELGLKELAYGSEKAKELFRDMLEQAADEVGFEAENIPLMIEAIPASKECLILLVTKVAALEDDDEEYENAYDDYMDDRDTHDDFIPLSSVIKQLEESKTDTHSIKPDVSLNCMIRCFSFACLDDVFDLADVAGGTYNGRNTLFKQKTGAYILVLYPMEQDAEALNQLCNIASEYGQIKHMAASQPDADEETDRFVSYLEEHEEIICKDQALQRLAFLS